MTRATASLIPTSSPTSRTTSPSSRIPTSTLHHHSSPVPLLPLPRLLLSSHPRRKLQSSWFALVPPRTSALDSNPNRLRIPLGSPSLQLSRSQCSIPMPPRGSLPLLAGSSSSGSSLRHGPQPDGKLPRSCWLGSHRTIPYPLSLTVHIVCLISFAFCCMILLFSLCCVYSFHSSVMALGLPIGLVPSARYLYLNLLRSNLLLCHTTITMVFNCTIP